MNADGKNHVDFGALADYWLAVLPQDDEEAVEEHVFACEECSRRLEATVQLADAVRRSARSGSLRLIVTDAYLERAAEQGLRVRQYAPPNGGGVECTVSEEDDILIARLAADLSGSKRVDISWCDANGVEQLRLPDIPVNAKAGEVVYQESISWAKQMPTMRLIGRLLDVDENGAERQLGEYTFNHTRTIGD